MIFKVYYQEDRTRNPKREETRSLYMEANSRVEVIERIEENTPYNIEHVVVLEGRHLRYEKEHAQFVLAEF